MSTNQKPRRSGGARKDRGSNRHELHAVSDWDRLTPSELRVIDLLADGLTNRQIADRLYVSHHTVETHLKHVFAKLGLASRTQVALAAYRRTA